MIPAAEQMLSDLIRLNTVNPPGNEFKVARYLQELFTAQGIAYEIIESEEGRANFIARLGSGTKSLLFLCHSDVVPAGEGWDFDPFSGEIAKGVVYGRGALDCKGLMAAQIHAFLRLAQEASLLNGTLIFAATADEERGGTHGVQYLLKNCPEKIRADFAVNEGGEGPRTINGRQIYFVQVGEKGTAWSRLQAAGRSCHGSVPTMGDNAVLKMARAFATLGDYRPEIRLIPEVRFLLQELIRIKELEEPLNETNVDALLDKFTDRSFAETLRAMTRMTISPNTIAGGSKTNIVPDDCAASVDIRVLPGQDRDYVLSELQRCIGEDIAIEIGNYAAPTFSSAQSAHYQLITAATQELTGADTLCLPHISPGATDSRYLREAGIPAYGIGHMARDSDPDLGATIHGKNERIDVASLYFRADFFMALARKYLC